MKSKALFFALFTTIMLQAAPPVEEGKAIFNTRCASCHNINKQVLGPALAGVDQRRSIEWIVNFVHSSQTVIKNGDKDAVALFKQFNNIPMPDHKDLSEDQIKNVVEYIKTESKGEGVTAKAPANEATKTAAPGFLQIVAKSPSLLLTFSILLLLLTGVLLFAYQVKQYQRGIAAQK